MIILLNIQFWVMGFEQCFASSQELKCKSLYIVSSLSCPLLQVFALNPTRALGSDATSMQWRTSCGTSSMLALQAASLRISGWSRSRSLRMVAKAMNIGCWLAKEECRRTPPHSFRKGGGNVSTCSVDCNKRFVPRCTLPRFAASVYI